MSDSKNETPNPTTGWQPIEVAPQNGTIVDLWVPSPDSDGYRLADCLWSDDGWKQIYAESGGTFSVNTDFAPSHWMHLPEPPMASKPDDA